MRARRSLPCLQVLLEELGAGVLVGFVVVVLRVVLLVELLVERLVAAVSRQL